MTTVCWDGKRMAADKQVSSGGLKRTVTKIARIGMALVGASGESDLCGEMLDWIRQSADASSFPKRQLTDSWVSVLMVTPDRKVWMFCQSPIPILYEDAQIAIGSGRDFALAAMYLGLPADQAIAVASHFDCGTGMGVDVLELEPAGAANDAG